MNSGPLIRFKNTSSSAISLKGWVLKDLDDHKYTDTSATEFQNRKACVWNDTSDTATLSQGGCGAVGAGRAVPAPLKTALRADLHEARGDVSGHWTRRWTFSFSLSPGAASAIHGPSPEGSITPCSSHA